MAGDNHHDVALLEGGETAGDLGFGTVGDADQQNILPQLDILQGRAAEIGLIIHQKFDSFRLTVGDGALIELTVDDISALDAGDVFELILLDEGAALNGMFAGVDLVDLKTGAEQSLDLSALSFADNAISLTLPTLSPVIPDVPGVPEPATWVLMILGSGMLLGFRRKNRETA